MDLVVVDVGEGGPSARMPDWVSRSGAVTDLASVSHSDTSYHFCNVHISDFPAGNTLLLSFPRQDHVLGWPQPWGQVFIIIYISVTGKLIKLL